MSELTVMRKTLQDALARAAKVAPPRSSNPALSNVYIMLEPSSQELTMYASNGDVALEQRLSVDYTGEQQQISVPAHMLEQIIRSSAGDLVTIKCEPDSPHINIKCGTNKSQLQKVDPGDDGTTEQLLAQAESYLQDPEKHSSYHVSGQELIHALEATSYATASAEYQAIFRGAKFELSPESARVIATDGFRLAYSAMAAAPIGDATQPRQFVIPRSTLSYLVSSSFIDANAVYTLTTDNHHHVASVMIWLERHIAISVKTMEGTFPDYQRVIPSQYKVEATVSAKALYDALARVQVLSDKSSNNRVDITLEPQSAMLELAVSGGYGSGEEALGLQSITGASEPFTFAFNARYLTDALRPFGDSLVSLKASGKTSPAVIVEESQTVDTAPIVAMVVPLRTTE